MLDDGRSCDEIVLQMAAVKKAVATAAISLITASLTECLADNTLDASAVVDVLQKLYLSLA